MKKTLILAITAAAAVAGSQALAANFAAGDLLQVTYSTNAGVNVNEYARDLNIGIGTMATGNYAGTVQSGLSGPFSVGYLAIRSTTAGAVEAYVSYNTDNLVAGAPMTSTNPATFKTNGGNFYSLYQGAAGGTNSATIDVSNALNPSWYQMFSNSGTAPGSMSGLFQTGYTGSELSLATIQGASAGYVDQYLYHMTIGNRAAPVIVDGNANVAGLNPEFIVRTYNNGGVELLAYGTTPAPVPIPGALVLLGSGLAGLLGIRRKVS